MSDAPNCEALDTPLVAVPTSIRSKEPAVDARRSLVFALSVPSPNAGLSASTGSGGEGGAETGSAGDAGRALGSTRRRSASSVRMATPWMATTTIRTHVDVSSTATAVHGSSGCSASTLPTAPAGQVFLTEVAAALFGIYITYYSLCVALHINAQLRTQDAQAQTVEKGIDSNDSQKSALGPRKANAMTASSVSSS